MSLHTETLHATPWLALKNIHLGKPGDEARVWTYATRPGCPGGVCVIATTDGPVPDILLVRQHRFPAGRPVIEFPAGLMDDGENPGETALRELAEETGWAGKITRIGPATLSSAGLTDETIHFVEVTLSTAGVATPEEHEAIEVLQWPLAELRQRLETAAAAGDGIDSKLWTYALARD